MSEKHIGEVVQVIGPVLDIRFAHDELPPLLNAIEIDNDGAKLVAEVAQQVGDDVVRCIAMNSTDGLVRGAKALDTGGPISVPVGEECLGRVFNLLGDPVDNLPAPEAKERWSIHRQAPSYEEQMPATEILETGIKVVDLIAPYLKGGKIGLFGGAGVGKTVLIMELINNIFEFGDKEAKDIMTPRQKIVAVENTQTVEQALQLAVENNFSRYPVYEEDLDNIIGLVHIKDLIAVYMKDPKTPVAGMVDKAIVTHPTKDVSELLQRMQREKIHMAVVVDEYGQTEGIVTMEDILEEIVGNILDEHDEEQPEEIQKQSEDEYLVDGGATLEDLEDLLGIEFPDEDFETVNGFLLYEHGRLPEEGESFKIEYQGYEFIPVKIEDNRIITVKITKLKEEE